MSSAPSPSANPMSDEALLAAYNVTLDDNFGLGDDEDDEDDMRLSSSPLSLPSSMLDSDDEGYVAAVASSKRGGSSSSSSSSSSTRHTTALTTTGGIPESFTVKLARMEQDVARLAHEKELLTSDLVRERKKHRDDVASLRRRNRSDFGQVRSKQAELEAEVPVLRARLDHTKETLRNLEVSSALYAELDRMSETQLSVREFVLVQVHRLVKKERDEAERSRREAESLRTTLALDKADAERAFMELQHRATATEDRCELQKKELERVQKEKAELAASLSTASDVVASLRSKGASYDIVAQRATTLEREVETTRHRAELLQSSLDQTLLEKNEASSKTLELRQTCEVLTVDKAYLTREVEAKSTRCSRLDETVQELREQKRTLMEAKSIYRENISKERDEVRRKYEDRLTKEINKLQKETAMELSQIRDAQIQVHETEVSSLKDRLRAARDAQQECSLELRELRTAHDDLIASTSKERASHEASMSELRSRLKIKAFEHGRLSLLVEEQRDMLNTAKQETDRQSQRFTILRDEFVKLEATASRREIEHEATLAMEREKVLGYEALEMELDGAFMSEAKSGRPGTTSTLLPVSCLFFVLCSWFLVFFSLYHFLIFIVFFLFISHLQDVVQNRVLRLQNVLFVHRTIAVSCKTP